MDMPMGIKWGDGEFEHYIMERGDNSSASYLFPGAVGIVLSGFGGVGLPLRTQWVAPAQHNGGEPTRP